MNPTMIPYSTAVACAVVTNVKAVTTAQATVEDHHDQAPRGQRQTLVATLPNRPLRLVPSVVTARMMTMAMSPTMRPYSTAVAPRSLRRAAALS